MGVEEVEGALPFAQVKVSGDEVVAPWNVTIPLQGDPADTEQSIEISEGAELGESAVEVEHVPVVDIPVRAKAAR